jgi:hypothetical protein
MEKRHEQDELFENHDFHSQQSVALPETPDSMNPEASPTAERRPSVPF